MNIGSLAIAVAELKMVQSVIAAIDAVAPGLGGPGKVERGVDRFEPRRVLHPTGAVFATNGTASYTSLPPSSCSASYATSRR